MTEEEWRPVVGYEGLYEVSDQGRVRSLDRVIMRWGGFASGRPVRVRGQIRKLPKAKAGGYLIVSLSRDGFAVQHYVHALVLGAFRGPRPDGLDIRHLDGDPENARLDNLAYGTARENQLDVLRHGRHAHANKTHCPQGHPYDDENTRVIPSRPTARYCRTCQREHSRQWERRQAI